MAKLSKVYKYLSPNKFTVRVHNRCLLCGRARGFMRKFKMCRLCFRSRAHKGQIPGVTKSSW